MSYRISKTAIKNIAEVLPDAFVIENGNDVVELVLQGEVDPSAVSPIAIVVDEDSIDEYRKTKRQQFIDEVREVQSLKHNISKRVLSSIVNSAIRSIHT